MGQIAIVAGSTGLVGKELVRKLADSPDYDRVIALVRRSVDGLPDKAEPLRVDYDGLERELPEELVQGAHLFCALGTTIRTAGSQAAFRRIDFDYPLALARLGARCGASQFHLVSSMGANPASNIFYNRVKGEVEQAVAGAGLPSVTIYRPSLLLGHRAEFRLGEKIAVAAAPLLALLLIGPWRKYRPIRASRVAESMLAGAKTAVPGVRTIESDGIEALAASG